MPIRQPIVSVLGHVDHGKTTLLDTIRGSSVASREKGAITQHIGASEVPLGSIRELCGPLLSGKEFRLPGLLFIDTPGHHSFSTLRARGGALADLAILVVDVGEGFRPQTEEALSVLKKNRTPFVVAANKIDRIHGWESHPWSPFVESLKTQSDSVKEALDSRLWEIAGSLVSFGIPSADRYDRIQDFRKSVAIVPVCARTGEGVPDLLLVLVGLAQKYLESRLSTDVEGPGKGTVLEVKEERGLGLTLDAILYDGTLRVGDPIVFGTRGGPRISRIRGILKPAPKEEMRDPRESFTAVREVFAASGVKILAPDLEGALPGSPLLSFVQDPSEALREVERSIRLEIPLEEGGIFLKADTLGSLEALARELSDRKIPIARAEVGDVSRRDIVDAETIGDPLRRVLLAFNVRILPEAKEYLSTSPVEVLQSDVIYHLLDSYEEWVEKKKRELEEKRREEMTFPGKFLLLPDHVFRISKPAIVGIRVLGGRVRAGSSLLRGDGRAVGKIRSLRREDQTLEEARSGEEVACAIEDVTVGRQISPGDVLFVDVPESDARTFLRSPHLLSDEEREVLEELLGIRRKADRFFAM